MNLRNRLIWIAVLTVGFAAVQLAASRRKADQERSEYLSSKLTPLVTQCIEAGKEHPSTLTLQVSLAPEGKLQAVVEQIEVPAQNPTQAPELVSCLRERAKDLTLPLPLPRGPEQVELTLQL